MTFFRCAAVIAATILMMGHAAAQGTPEQRAACTGDALSFCGEFVPNVELITACLRKNLKKISPECRAQFRPGTARSKPRATPVSHSPSDRHPVH